MPIRHPARLCLHVADGVAQVEIDVALKIGDVVAELRKAVLHADALDTRKRHVMRRPRRADGA